MTSRERIVAANSRKPVDHVPCSVAFNPLTPVQRKGHEWQFPWPVDATPDEQLRYQVEELGLDQTVSMGLSPYQPPVIETELRIDGDILHKTCHTPAGELHASVRYNDLWPHGEDIPFFSDFNVGHYVEPWIRTEQDLEAFISMHPLADDAELERRADAGAADARRRAAPYDLAVVAHVGMGMTGEQHLFGSADLCMMTIENPDLVDAYLEFEHQANLKALQALANKGVDMIRRNGFYETADFYSPAMLERFLGQRLRRERQVANAGGMLMTYTAHTGVEPILDYLASLRLDSVFGIDIAFQGIDLTQVRDKLAAVSSLWIGPSSTYHLWKGPEATREAVQRVFEVFDRTGLILSPGVSSHAIMPWESTLAMIDEWKRLR